MKPSAEKFVAYNLRETYHELGQYEFKVVLNPKHFRNSHLCEVTIVDSEGKPMRTEVKKWGRKINCLFTIDPSTSDGVSQVKLVLRDEEEDIYPGRLTFWVIKP